MQAIIKNIRKNPALLIMLIAAVVGLVGSFMLSLETVHHLKNPKAELSCSINIFVNCATVMDSEQSEIFGLPNIFLGLMAFASLITIIVVALSGAKLPKWMMACVAIGSLFSLLFLIWLFYNSVFVINVLCPWCLVIAVATIVLFGATSRWSLRANAFNLSSKNNKIVQRFLDRDFDKIIAAALFVVMLAILIVRYADKF